MSNSKSDQTVAHWCMANPRSNEVYLSNQNNLTESNQQEKSPRGQGLFTSKGHFYPKRKFQEEVNYRKKYLNECSYRNANNLSGSHALIS